MTTCRASKMFVYKVTKCLHKSSFVRRLHCSPGVQDFLSDIKILDLTRILAGPFCSMLLSDLGAQVIKVERAGKGDDTRKWGPPFINGESYYYLAINRNKKSVAVDLKNPKGLEVVRKLAATSDVLIENFIPGKVEELGLDYKTLKGINNRLIYCSISGFGQTGPMAKRPGFDVVAASLGGLLSITGPEGGEPCKVGVPVTDLTTGLYAKSSILAALHRRSRTGTGCWIDCNLLSSQISMLVHLGTAYANLGIVPAARGSAHDTVVPYQAFKCADNKWITLGGGSDRMFVKLLHVVFPTEVAESLAKDKRFITNADRVKNRKALVDLIASEMALKPSTEWLSKLESSGVAFGEVNRLDEAFAIDQVGHNESVITVEHTKLGNLKLLGPAVKFRTSDEDNGTTKSCKKFSPPPLLGEHTIEVLKELGYEPEEIAEMRRQRIIQCAE